MSNMEKTIAMLQSAAKKETKRRRKKMKIRVSMNQEANHSRFILPTYSFWTSSFASSFLFWALGSSFFSAGLESSSALSSSP